MKKLNWLEFEECIFNISEKCKDKSLIGVYGIPRGGSCIAVAVSHALNIPFLDKPISNSIIVDDVYETGDTLNAIKDIPGITVYVWLSKEHPTWWNAVEICETKEWLVFPWENKLFSEIDQKKYRLEHNQNL